MQISTYTVTRLLRWFAENGRHALPWRQNRTPYRVWVSEIMLQQTQVKTVLDYFSRFLSAFPDVQALAEAEEETVLRQWEGLGYYRRARQLHAASKIVAARENAAFPESFSEILALPGIGRYSAGAILSFALDQRFPILEANTQRLFARLCALETPTATTSAQKKLWATAEQFVSEETSHESPCDINTALMDLGNLICTPQNPRCEQCPFLTECEAKLQNLVDQIPVAAPKTVYETRNEAAVLITRSESKNQNQTKGLSPDSDPEILILRYVTGEWWAGLWDFPRTQIPTKSPEKEIKKFVQKTVGLNIALSKELETFHHSVTHFRITLRTFLGTIPNQSSTEVFQTTPAGGEIRWVKVSELDAFPLASTGRKIVHMIQKKGVTPAADETTKDETPKLF